MVTLDSTFSIYYPVCTLARQLAKRMVYWAKKQLEWSCIKVAGLGGPVKLTLDPMEGCMSYVFRDWSLTIGYSSVRDFDISPALEMWKRKRLLNTLEATDVHRTVYPVLADYPLRKVSSRVRQLSQRMPWGIPFRDNSCNEAFGHIRGR